MKLTDIKFLKIYEQHSEDKQSVYAWLCVCIYSVWQVVDQDKAAFPSISDHDTASD